MSAARPRARRLLLALAPPLVALPSPLAAQEVAAPAATAADDAEARTALARRIVDRLWPEGTGQRLMDGRMAGTGAGESDSDDAAPRPIGKAERRAAHEARTGRTLPPEDDSGAPGGMVEAFDRGTREGLTRAYARRYDMAQLGEIDAFLSTPAGASFAAGALTMLQEAEVQQAVAAALSEQMCGDGADSGICRGALAHDDAAKAE